MYRSLSSIPPRARFRPFSLLWLLLGLCLVATIGVGALYATQFVLLPKTRVFTGELRYGHAPILIEAPKGAVISEVYVTRGDNVTAGQTLANLNTAALKTALQEAQEARLILQFRRECLLNPQTAGDIPSWSTNHPPEIQAQLRIAAQECMTEREALMLPVTKAQAAQDILQRRKELIDRRAALLISRGTSDTQENMSQQALDTVSALLAQNELDKQIKDANAATQQALITYRQNIVTQAKALSSDIKTLTQDIDQLTRLIQMARITSPTSGRIARVRIPRSQTPLNAAVNLFELEPMGTPSYVISTQVPWELAQSLGEDTPVKFRALGLAGKPQIFAGYITTIGANASTRNGQMVRLHIIPDANSLAALNDLSAQIALSGSSTASLIEVKLENQTLLHSLDQGFETITDFSISDHITGENKSTL